MYYEIVWDKEEVKKFAEYALGQLKGIDGSCICVTLFSRRKYNPELPRGEYILKRLFFDNSKDPDIFYRELLKLHVPYGCYDPPQINQESLCIYCMLRPKDQIKPLSKILNECIDSLVAKEDLPRNIIGKYHCEIGKSDYNVKNSQKLVQIDVDSKDPVFLEKFKTVLKECNIIINLAVETKNGFHLVFRKNENCDMAKLHKYKLETSFVKKNREGKDMTDYLFNTTNEPSVIIPGTYQGGYRAHYVDF